MDRANSPNISKDRISELPDEILCCMLLLLPRKEAVRSSILSHRWRYVWKTSLYFLSCLTLDFLSMRGSDYSDDMFGVLEAGRIREDGNLLSIERLKFVKWVDYMLQLDYSPVINSFRLRFDLNKDFANHIDRWISVAIYKRVQNFDIDLSNFILQEICFPKLYTFPYWLFTQETGSVVKSLCLRCCILRPPIDFNCFSSLLDMKLENVVVNQDSFDSLLPNCLNLEKLHLVKCWQLVRLKISGSLLKLKDLAVVHCTISKFIEIDAINLARLEYWGDPVNISFVNVPQLSTVIIYFKNDDDSSAMNFVMQNLASHAPKLELLMPAVHCTKNPFIPGQLANLTKLVLMMSVGVKGTLWGLIPLLHACPLLDTLELNWVFYTPFESWEEGLKLKPSCDHSSPHHNLKNITISGFWSSAHEVEFTTYLVSNTKALKKISIFYRSNKRYTYWRGHYILTLTEPSEIQKKLEEQSKLQLMEVLPPGVEIQLFFYYL